MTIFRLLTDLIRDDEGQDLIEYALLAAFVSLAAISGATLLGTALKGWFGDVSGTVSGMATGPST